MVKFSGKNILCFCEDVTVEEFLEAVEKYGIKDLQLLKRLLGIGTGPCQGKQCIVRAALLLALKKGIKPSNVRLTTFRPPSRPIPLGVLIHGELGEE